MPSTLLRYRWRYFDPVGNKSCVTKYHATEEEIRRQHPDATPVPGSEQALVLAEDPLAHSIARFQIDVVGR